LYTKLKLIKVKAPKKCCVASFHMYTEKAVYGNDDGTEEDMCPLSMYPG